MIFSTYSYGFPGFNNHNTLHSSIFTEKNQESGYSPIQIQDIECPSNTMIYNDVFYFPENLTQDEDKLIVGDIDDTVISHNVLPISGENNHFLELKEEKIIKIENHSSEKIKCSKYENGEKEISQIIIENDEKEMSQIKTENDEKQISQIKTENDGNIKKTKKQEKKNRKTRKYNKKKIKKESRRIQFFDRTLIRKEINKVINKLNEFIFVDFENIVRRKYKPDDIRKRIKSNFFTWLRKDINNKLKSQNYKKEFKFLKCFVEDLNKERNKEFINNTIKELLTKDFYSNLKKNKEKSETTKNDNNVGKVIGEDVDDKSKKRSSYKDGDLKKYKDNLEIMAYLNENEDLRRKINFDSLEKKTFAELFNEYLESGFDYTIFDLKKEEEPYYVNEYIIKAYEFIKYFSE